MNYICNCHENRYHALYRRIMQNPTKLRKCDIVFRALADIKPLIYSEPRFLASYLVLLVAKVPTRSSQRSTRPHICYRARSAYSHANAHQTFNRLLPEKPHNLIADNNPWPRRFWRRIARVLYHFHKLAFLEVHCAALAPLFLMEILRHNVDVFREFFHVEKGNEGCHFCCSRFVKFIYSVSVVQSCE